MNGAHRFALSTVLLTFAMNGPAWAQSQPQTTAPANPPASGVPRSVPFSGQVTPPHAGAVLLTFGLYTDQQDGAPIWTEQHLVALDGEGRYSVILGSVSAEGLPADAFAAGTAKWLGVQIEGGAEQPRLSLLSVPYALKAADADTIAGKPATEFMLSSHLAESVKKAIAESVKLSALKDSPAASAPLVTTNALVKYLNSGGATTESSTVDVAGFLGINVNPPINALDIRGAGSTTAITLRAGGIAADVVKLVGPDGSLRIGSATTANLISLVGPNVGIGTGTTVPSRKLQVAGDLFVGGNVYFAVDAETSGAGAGVFAYCSTPQNNCVALYGFAQDGDYAGYMTGGRGLYIRGLDSNYPAVDARGESSYGVRAVSGTYRGAYALSNSGFFGLYVDAASTSSPGIDVAASAYIEGDMVVVGAKTGYVADIMRNADATALEPGDVVVINGNSEPVLGRIPVVTVKKASAAYDSGVVGVVDRTLYVPTADTRAAYKAQQAASRAYDAARTAEDDRARARGAKSDHSAIEAPTISVNDAQGTLHAIDAVTAEPGDYIYVVTLGAYHSIKVDASFGSIHAGDLLTTSPTPGYAMKVTDKVAAIGAIVGKALGDLEKGTGTVPVMITPK